MNDISGHFMLRKTKNWGKKDNKELMNDRMKCIT